MALEFDHLVIATRTLQEGVAWLESRVGVPMGAGGKHALMGTHNRLLALGPGRFLEVIAIDPDAPPPGRPRWFELDAPDMRARVARGPALVHWVVRSDDIERAIAAIETGKPEVLPLVRGDFHWKIGVPADGGLAHSGTWPTVVQWEGKHPTDVLPDSGCRLESLVLHHPEAPRMLDKLRLAGFDPEEPVAAHPGSPRLQARLATPRGIVDLGE